MNVTVTRIRNQGIQVRNTFPPLFRVCRMARPKALQDITVRDPIPEHKKI